MLISVLSAAALALTALGLWLTFGLPKARLRHRFFETAMGKPAEAGMEAEPSIFERLGSVETSLDGVQKTLGNGMRSEIRAVGSAVDALDHRVDELDHRIADSNRIAAQAAATADVVANVVAEDIAEIWIQLHEAGLDRRQGDEG